MNKTTKFEHREPGIPLPYNYQPSPHTVIVGRGKGPKTNVGNQRLRVLAQSFLQRYQDGDKKCKTQIVSDIIIMVRGACKGGKGAFVKHDAKKGQWYDLDNSIAREKIGCIFRDLLADQYKSSSKSKVVARKRHSLKSTERRESSSSIQSYSSSCLSLSSASSCRTTTTMMLDEQHQEELQQDSKIASNADAGAVIASSVHSSNAFPYCHTSSDRLANCINPIGIPAEGILSDVLIRSAPPETALGAKLLKEDPPETVAPGANKDKSTDDDMGLSLLNDEEMGFDYSSLLNMPLL